MLSPHLDTLIPPDQVLSEWGGGGVRTNMEACLGELREGWTAPVWLSVAFVGICDPFYFWWERLGGSF